MARCDMASFSDAHETTNIPMLAAQLQRLILPRQSQIWAVLHAADSADRLVYSLSATFYGRMCISGEIEQLNGAQRDWLQRGMAFYQGVAGIIKHGRSELRDSGIGNRRHSRGWQTVLRLADDGRQALLVAHAFDIEQPVGCTTRLPEGTWTIAKHFHTDAMVPSLSDGGLSLHMLRPHCGLGLLLQRA
jgi:alpha-galactosidase